MFFSNANVIAESPLQEFRSSCAHVLAVMVCVDFVNKPDDYKAKEAGASSLNKILEFIATLGMSKQDLPTELRNRMVTNADGQPKVIRKRGNQQKQGDSEKASKAPKVAPGNGNGRKRKAGK